MMKYSIVSLFLLSLSPAMFPMLAAAQENNPGQLELHAGAENLDGLGGGATFRHSLGSGDWLGLRLSSSALRERFIDGYAVDTGAVFEGGVDVSWLLRSKGAARFSLTTGVGTRFVASDPTPAGSSTYAVTTDLVPTVEVDLSQDVVLVTALRVGIDVAVDPSLGTDLIELPFEVGLRWWVTPQLALKPLVFVGPATGYDGDGAKHRLGGRVGLAYSWDRSASSEVTDEESREKPSSVGAFVGFEWRGLALSNHVSHGPGFRAGVSFFDGYLKVGIAGLSRPGPLTTNTFQTEAVDGRSYKGNSTLTLKSDGFVAGLLIAGAFPLRDWMTLEIPLTVGQGGFGFYLFGDDRKTPDGRRVSAWENELLDGRDASIGLAVDTGVRVLFTPNSVPWLRPLVGVHYTLLPNYDAYVVDSYDGASVVAGMELGVF